ncbi:hypothetical protein [Amycolatopsis taiwanensis]|uniref:Uncharacterized protein n=1 Tax=Amycolatopsis taiwanensis TaxID=342230 RepID=A0A9W6VC82_9PSEU|nr:hypothetical protein [Amycolatopsis taiwanensis]GLY63515.1 hypothetical protein Atai01_01340 [Amycolatopsis taiwanensis]
MASADVRTVVHPARRDRPVHQVHQVHRVRWGRPGLRVRPGQGGHQVRAVRPVRQVLRPVPLAGLNGAAVRPGVPRAAVVRAVRPGVEEW